MENKMEQLINSFYAKFQTYDPFEISNSINIPVKYAEFLKRPLGRTTHPDGTPVILISTVLKDKPERYFVCAHELFHAVEHKTSASYYKSNVYSKIKMEVESNTFATSLLLKDYILKFNEMPKSFSLIQKEYGIPSNLKDYIF